MPSVSLNENSVSAPPESQQQTQPGGPHSYPPPPPHQQQPPPPPTGHHQYPGGGYPAYPGRTGYEHGPPQHHVNNSDPMAVSQQHPYQHPYPPHQQPPMRFPGKPLPGGPPGSQQQQPPPGSGQYPPQQMRSGGYPPTGPAGMTGQSISQQTGPTPTLNSLLQPGGGGGSGAGGSAGGAGATGAPPGSAPPSMPGHGSPHRYPPPPSGYEHNSYNMPPHSKSDYPAGPQGWPPPASNQRPPVNSAYGHPPPPSFQQQQAMYRQNAPPSGGRSSGGPPGPPPQHPGQYYQPPGMHHPPPPHQQGGFPPPPPQSPHYPPPHAAAQRYPGPGMRTGENQPPSHYPPGPSPGMPPESSGLAPPGPQSSSGQEGGHPPKSTPPPPQSPSLAQQQMNHAQNNPPSPQQSPRSTPVQSQQHPPTSSAPGGIPPSSSPSHRPQGSSPSNSYPPPPDSGDCNSNDSGPGASGVRPSPSPTGSASSRPMSPAVGSQNIPVPPRPSSSQSDGPPRMSQSPMPGSYPGQPSMAPPPHHGYPPGGKMGHPNAGMIPPGHPHPSSPQHYPQGQQHWQHQPGQQGYGARPPHHGSMMSPYPPPSQQPMPPNNYPPPRHPVPNHVGGPPPPPQSQYSPYPPPQYGGQPPSQQAPQPWASPTPPGPGGPPNQRSHPSHPAYLKQHLQQKLGFSPPPHGQGYPGGPMGPPQTSNMSSTSPSQTPPPGSHPQQHLLPPGQQGPPDGDNSNSGGNPPNIVSVGPDGTNVDDVSQQSTLSNTSGASGGDDGPAMPKLRKEGSVGHQSYPSHPATPQSNAVPSPGAASMSSTHEEYGPNSPGWPRTPASPGLNSHPQPPSEQFKPKAKVKKKPDSLQKLYDMDDNPDRRGFIDKLMQFMDEHNTPITACPTISKNPLDLFKLYFLVKERGGFLEVTKNKTWKDIAGSLGIGASSSAAYTLRKHYTKHLLPFECKFDRGGIDPQPLINQVESTSKKKGPKVAPVPSPGSSNSQDSFQGANNNSTSSMDGFNSASGGPPTPYGVHPPSEYNQSNSSSGPPGSGNSGPGGNSSAGASTNSTPPLRPPAQSPVAPPPQTGPTPPQPPHSHSGEKTHISASNPFDDLQQQPPQPPHLQQHPHQFHALHQYNQHQQLPPPPHQNRPNYQYHAQYSTSTSTTTTTPPGYQGPPGSYPPYSSPSGEQYPGRPSHEAYNQQGYGGPGYPPHGPGRPMYPYPDTSSAGGTPPSQSGYPPQGSSPHQSQAPSQPQQPQTSGAGPTGSSSGSDDRYSMGPPPPGAGASANAPPGQPVNYPSHPGRMPGYPPTTGAPGHPPPNGYPNQDYYHSQPPPSEQGYTGMPGQSTPHPPGSGKHGPPSQANQRRLDFQPGKEQGALPGASPPSHAYPGYPPQGQPRMPSYDGQGTKGGYMFHPPPPPPHGGSRESAAGSGGRDHGSGTPIRSSPSPSPAASASAPPNASHHHHHHPHHNAATSATSQSASTSSLQPPPAPTPHSNNTINKPPWIPSEGWPTGGGQYPPHQRPYPPGPPNSGTPPHGTPPPPQSSSPAGQTPTSATPSQPGAPPSWAPPGASGPGAGSSRGPPPGSSGPQSTPNASGGQWSHPPPPDHASSRYGPGSGGPPQTPPQSASPGGPVASHQPPWTPPGGRGQMRPPFPVPGKPGDMYKPGYGPPPGASPSPAVGPASGGPPPVLPGGKGPSGMPPPPPVTASTVPGAPAPQTTFPPAPPAGAAAPGLPLPAVPPPVPVKKEIVFPPDSVEAVTPVLPRRKKLHKSDVAPVEAWRIMMCLKSGLLAETTWALDVLNVLLFDDHSISYFSLSYLPGLLETLLEQLRRALILIFGNSIGIEVNTEKAIEDIQPLQEKKGCWYELEERDDGEEPDIGTPRKKFPRDGHRTVVLQGATNYTMVSRVGRKTVGIVGKDDEPFVLSGPRDWDMEEKLREANESDLGAQSGNVGSLMELTKHVVTSFTADLNIVPVVRVLKPETADSRTRLKRKRRRSSSVGAEKSVPEIKREPQDCDDDASSELNLEIYKCETKMPNEMVVSSSSTSNSSNSTNGHTEKSSKKNSSTDGASNNNSSSANITKTEPLENSSSSCSGNNTDKISQENDLKNCLSVAQQNNRKLKKLDEIMDRIKSEVGMDDVDQDVGEHCDKRMNGLPEADDNCSMMETSSLALDKGTSNDSSSGVIVNGDLTVATSDTNASGSASNVMTSSSDSDVKQATSIGGTNDCDEVPSGDESAQTLKNCVRIGSILVQDHGSTLKRRKLEEFEDECYTRDEPSLYQVTETQDALARRCLSIFNILRNLTFVPGNECEFGKSIPFLSLIGKLILIHHDHPLKGKPTSKKFKLDGDDENGSTTGEENGEESLEDEEDDGLLSANRAPGDIDVESCTSLNGEGEWWWDYVHHLREHVLVMIANISGQMDLSQFSEEISRPILDGLLHWAVCPAAYGQDPFPTLGPNSNLSPQRLAIEALCKLSVTQGNMDLLLATPPYSRIERLCQLLCRSLCPSEDQVMREFAINLLSYLSAADSGVARTIALQNPCISLLISFIEQAEVNANNISMNHGFQVLRENPEAMGTSLDMLRRAATTLFNLARHPDNRALFVQHEPRLLQLVMSHILEQKVAAIVAQVLFQCSAPDSPSSKYFHTGSNYDTFYSIARSRSIVSRNKH